MREGNQTLEEYCFIEQGIVSGADKVSDALIAKYPSVDMEKGDGIYILTDKEIKAKAFTAADKSYLKRTYKNSDLEKWAFNPDDSLYVLYIKSTGKYFEVSPKVKAHLDKYKLVLINRNVRVGSITEKDYEKFLKDKMEISYIMNASSMKAGNYYCLSYPRRGKDTFEVPKIVNSRRAYANIFAYEDQGFYEQSDLVVTTLKPAYHNKLSLYYILGILNSKLLYQWFYHKGKRKGELLELFQKPISEVPIKYVEPKQQSGISKLVEKIVDSKKQNPHAEVSRLEKQLDIMVYHLYDLDYNEAKMIDASLSEEEFKKYT